MWIERIATIIAMAGTIAGGMIWMNDHYASAADLKGVEKSLRQDILSGRIRDLNNKIFELEFKQRSTPKAFSALDAALLERYKNDLAELQAKARDLEKD